MNGSVKKNGFTTLNRLLGKKSKDSTMSKSTSNLTRTMSQHDNSSSQNNNKIIPLSNMSNAPFEQTFRITVCLPQNQLFVTRLGAKTQLSVLLKMVCDNKDLDSDKYEFRHPADNTQPFHNELTIGLVGLNELRLVLKTDKYTNTNDTIIKQKQLTGRESLQSIDLSKNLLSRQYLKTTSPYSSTNSLNSIDSSGMSTSSRGGSSGYHHPPIAPIRKKRAAPRPPSQNSIPEQYIIDTNNDNNKHDINFNTKTIINNEFKEPHPVMPRKSFFVSSPNLSNHFIENNNLENKHKDYYDSNGSVNHTMHNGQNGHNNNRHSSVTDLNKIDTINHHNHQQDNHINNRPVSIHIIRQKNENNCIKKLQTFNGGSITNINHSRTSSESSEFKDGPEPTPRKRLFSAAKKKAPPAPPRGLPPVPLPREKRTDIPETTKSIESETISEDVEKSNDSDLSQQQQQLQELQQSTNVSKVMLNVKTSNQVETIQVDLKQSPEPVKTIQLNKIEETIPVSVLIQSNGIKEEQKIPVSLPIQTNGIKEEQKIPVSVPIQTNGIKEEQEIIIKQKIPNSISIQPNIPKEIEEKIPNPIPIQLNNLKVEEKQISPEKIPISVSINSTTTSIESETLSTKSDINSDDDENKIHIYNLKLEKPIKTTNTIIEKEILHNHIKEISPIIVNQNTKMDVDETDNSKQIHIENLEKRLSSSPPQSEINMLNEKSQQLTDENEIIPVRKLSNKILERIPSPSPRSQSPLWTYTLPAPPKFADDDNLINTEINNHNDKIYYNNDYLSSVDNLTIISDSNTTFISDIDIKPIIQERNNIIIENNLYNNSNNDNNKSQLSETITSDIEDGYHCGISNGNGSDDIEQLKLNRIVFIENLEKHREKTINHELNYLLNENNLIVKSDKIDTKINNDNVDELNKKISAIKTVDISEIKIDDKINHNNEIETVIPNDVDKNNRINIKETMENTKNHVIEQLTTVINNNKLDNIIRRPNNNNTNNNGTDLYFEDSNRMSISNFKMSTYSNNYTNIKSLDERKHKNCDDFNEDDFINGQLQNDKKIIDVIENNNEIDDSSNKKRREFMPIKRRSLTLSNNIFTGKSSSTINRSGSFHSTRLDNIEKSEETIPRSSSYLSLITAEQKLDERLSSGSLEDVIANRRRSSSSEQSISNSPSLQSLEIMKMILPSLTPKRQSITEEEPIIPENLINKEIPIETKEMEVEEVVKVEKIENIEKIEKIELNNNKKEEEHKWKYQGPPSIKLASWNERPKIEVAIKSDKDYKFGGSTTLPRGYRNVDNKPTERTVAPISTVEIDQTDNDIVYRNSKVILERKEENIRLPFVRSVEYKKPITYEKAIFEEQNSSTTSEIPAKPEISQKPNFYSTFSRPVSMHVGRPMNPVTTTATTTQTFLNRFSGNNFNNKYNPVVRGFKPDALPKESIEEPIPVTTTNHIQTNLSNTNSHESNNVKKEVETPAPKSNYRTSFGGFNSTFKMSNYEVSKHVDKPVLPFSQNTLRRTGFKDKIMPVEVKEKPKINSLSGTIVTQIHLKQQETVTKEKLQENNTNQSNVVSANVVIPPPPPKMAPIIRNVFPKKRISVEIDPHDQLLSSIRNFNKTALKRS